MMYHRGKLNELKTEYRELKKRFDKATEFYENESVSQKDKDKFYPAYKKLVEDIRVVYNQIILYENQEVMEGYHGEYQRQRHGY